MAGNLESQVSVLCLNPTGVAASISGGILRCDRASGDPVEKQVFADCPDRGTTAAVGGKPPLIQRYRIWPLLSHNPRSGPDRGTGHETPRFHNFTRRRNGWMAIRRTCA